jgi:tetratricopeptide (TPR) repeat protein
LALAPDSLEALRQRGAVHLDLHDWRGAAADFSRAIDIDADAADLRLNLALALDQAGDSATARRVLTELIERESRNTAALNRRAAILWRQSADPSPQDPALRAAAIADWRRSLAANPDQPEIRSLLDAALTDGQ